MISERISDGLVDISVIIPCYNSDKYIADTIKAAQVALQFYSSSEIIVVNDGSTDLSETEIDKFSSVKKINIQNSGVSVARNIGAQYALGRYFLFCDADDLLVESAFGNFGIELFDKNPSVIFGNYDMFGPGSIGLPVPQPCELKYPDCTVQILDGVWRPSSSYLIRRDIFFKAGMFNPFLSVVADCNFYFKLFFVAKSDIKYVPKVFALYRKNHIGQSMATSDKSCFLYDCFFNAVEARLMWLKKGSLSDSEKMSLFSVFDFIGRESFIVSNFSLLKQCESEISGLGYRFPPYNSIFSKIIYFIFGFIFLTRFRYGFFMILKRFV